MSGDAAKLLLAGVGACSPGATSMNIFRRHMIPVALPGQTMVLDASGVVSKACFDEWVATRVVQTPNFDYEKSFQRALTAHLTGSDGRKPFEPEEEEAVLQVVRRKRTWAAFASTRSTVGQLGFRAMGYHERRRQVAAGGDPPSGEDVAMSLVEASPDEAASGGHGIFSRQLPELPASAAPFRPTTRSMRAAKRPEKVVIACTSSSSAAFASDTSVSEDLEVLVAPSSPLPETSEDSTFSSKQDAARADSYDSAGT